MCNSHSDVQFVPLWVCLLSFGKFVFIRGCSLSLEFCFGVFLICFALLVIDGPKVCLNSSLKASTHFELTLSTSCQPESLLLTFSTHGPNRGHCDWCRASKFIKRLSQWTCQNRRNEKPQSCRAAALRRLCRTITARAAFISLQRSVLYPAAWRFSNKLCLELFGAFTEILYPFNGCIMTIYSMYAYISCHELKFFKLFNRCA